MDSPIKLTNKLSRGFTLVEIVIVLSIMGLFATVSVSVYSTFQTHENLAIVTTGVVEAIRHAQANAMVGKGDSSWGVAVRPRSVTIFKGTSYASREVSSDQSLGFSGGVVASGLPEIVFMKLTGTTINTGTITLTNRYGTKNISSNEKGTLTY